MADTVETPPDPAAPADDAANPRWSVVIPYYNEAGFLPATVQTLLAQTLRPFDLILVDNASTDGSPQLARGLTDGVGGIRTRHLTETEPGQVHALETGIAAVETPFVAICDADTLYPETYLATADRVFRQAGDNVVAALAHGLSAPPTSLAGRLSRLKRMAVARLLPDQCHAGGYAHTFRTAALKAAGGYSKALWPYVLKDHELMHRVLKHGRAAYAWDFWCRASDRRDDRGGVRWTLSERLIYHVSPAMAKDWFFYRFLAPRFEARQMSELNLRQRGWEDDQG